MGFVRQPTIYKLVWPEGDEYHGLEVKVRAIPISLFFDLMKVVDVNSLDLNDIKPEDLSSDSLEAVTELFKMFADNLVDWNLQEQIEEGGPVTDVPPTAEGVMAQELGFVLMLVEKWMSVISDVTGPLGNLSFDGGKSPVPSMEMEPL